MSSCTVLPRTIGWRFRSNVPRVRVTALTGRLLRRRHSAEGESPNLALMPQSGSNVKDEQRGRADVHESK